MVYSSSKTKLVLVYTQISAAMDKALAMVDYKGLDHLKAAARTRGRSMGEAVATD